MVAINANSIRYVASDGGAGIVDVTGQIYPYEDMNGEVTAETMAQGSWDGNIAGGVNAAITSTAALVEAAIEAEATAAALVTVENKAGNNGTGVVTAMAETPLAGGVDGTVGAKGDVKEDTSYLYVAIAANTIADANWRRIALGSAY